MIERKKAEDILKYVNTPLSKESIAILYVANNITLERCELYGDFITSLVLLVTDTYLGDDITSFLEQRNHFKWCWKTTIEKFKQENIVLGDVKLYKYFLEFMMEVYYPLSHKKESSHTDIINLWTYIFNYNNFKSKSDMDTLIEVYKLFDNSLK